jgi:mannose-6-phosphate isomerase-like protein (cupin superfamily)
MEMHRITVKAGHCCSKHLHSHKWNGFYIERGELLVKVWQPSGTLDETRLGPGDTLEVPPGVAHQFVALTDVLAFEAYWHGPLTEDIIRHSVGGPLTPEQ